MNAPHDHSLRDAAARFVEAFEQVFDQDWSYTKDQLGIDERRDAANRRFLLEIFGEEPPIAEPPDATFLRPGRDLEGENWGNYEYLLRTYADLKRTLGSASA